MKNILKIILWIIFWIISFQNVFAKEECEAPNKTYKQECLTPEEFAQRTSKVDTSNVPDNPIQCGEGWLAWPGCSVNISQLVWVKETTSRKNLLNFTQDAVTGLTFFIWTVVLIALIYSGWLYLMAWGDEKMAEKWKNWIKNSIIGLVLVLLSYVIIRAIQYFAVWS